MINADKITALSETATAFALSHTATYDGLNRLSGFFNGTTTTSYTYDNNSNRLSSTLSGTTTYTISGTSNQLTALSGVTTQSFTWNADGNQTSDGTHSYGYDGRALLTTETTAGVSTSYGIDWQGQRLTKSGTNVPNGGANEYVYDEGGHLIGEYGSTGHIVNETVWLPDTPVSTVVTMATGNVGTYFGTNGIASPAAVLTTTNAATVSPVTPDWLNAPHIVTNSTKGYQWIWDHYAFGDNAPNQNPAGLGAFTYNPRFPGQYADSESGLNYNWNRSYGPAWGSYIQADPIGLAGGQASLYPYVGANPLTNGDPNGLDAEIFAGPVIITTIMLPPLIQQMNQSLASNQSPSVQNIISKIKNLFCPPKDFPPCNPGPDAGTQCYEENIGHSHNQWDPHYHIWTRNQNPSTGQCFWNRGAGTSGTTQSTPTGMSSCSNYSSWPKE